MKAALRSITVATSVFVGLPAILGVATPPTPEPIVDSYYVVSPASGGITSSSEIPDLIPEPKSQHPGPGTVSPQLINDPIAWVACFGPVFQNPDYPLSSYDWVPHATGTVYLQCGPQDTKLYGWHHIQDQHEKNWQTRANLIPAGPSWDDLMAVSATHVLDWPDRYTVEYGGKRCYYAYIEIWDANLNFLYSFNPTVIVSMTNNRVITSYPTTNQDCSRLAAWEY